MWFIYTVEYYLAMRNSEIWPFATTWMELEGITQSEISQAEKDSLWFHLYVDPEKLDRRPWVGGRGKKKLQRGREANNKRLVNTENQLRVDRRWGRGESGWWALRRAPVGMSTGYCMETNSTMNFILKKKKKNSVPYMGLGNIRLKKTSSMLSC